MGDRIYQEIIGFVVPWPYKDKQTYVIAHNDTNVTLDEMQITIVPTILGEGLPLFPDKPKTSKWTLVENKSFSTGLALLTYTKK